MAEKKITKVEDTKSSSSTATKEPAAKAEGPAKKTQDFKITEESKKKATNFRIIAIILWVLAIGAEVAAIILLRKPPIVMWQIIALIAVDLILAVCGSMLWKKANRFDPASEKDKAKFFIQNQLGVIIAVIAFLPLVVLIFMNKDMDKKQKGILGTIAIVALGAAGLLGADFNPPSVEQYAEQTAQVENLIGSDNVYWTKSGTRYHIYSDCSSINKDVTTEIFEGTVAQAREIKNITELCKFCENKAIKANGGEAADDAELEDDTEAEDTEDDTEPEDAA